jgi:ceramide glucosyltransferase
VDSLALAATLFTALITVCGIAYGLLALWAARRFEHEDAPAASPGFAPGISVLKPLKGMDPRMHAGLASHCAQTYAGPFEILFGVSDLNDPALAEVARLRIDHPHIPIHLIECPARLGSNGKLSNLAQMLPHAQYEHVLVNDSDILVAPDYLTCIAAIFAPSDRSTKPIGLVTAPYVGLASSTLYSKLEALGISTDFIPGALVARALEGGLRFGLGSTLATTKSALAAIGGFEALTSQLADDYELGARLHRAGFHVELLRQTVATTIPPYTLHGFCDHQLRWARGTRDSRRAGYLGLAVTYVVPWALLTILASGAALWSFTLLSLSLLVRLAVALAIGVGLLNDRQVLRDILLLPLRDCFGLFFWGWSFASNTVVWRGERFRLRHGELTKLGS